MGKKHVQRRVLKASEAAPQVSNGIAAVLQNAAVKRGHGKETTGSTIGAGLGGCIGSFAGPLGAVAGAAIGAWLGYTVAHNSAA